MARAAAWAESRRELLSWTRHLNGRQEDDRLSNPWSLDKKFYFRKLGRCFRTPRPSPLTGAHRPCARQPPLRIVFVVRHEHTDAPYAVALLRMRRERPRRRGAEARDELSTVHSITSSARSRNVGGIMSPI